MDNNDYCVRDYKQLVVVDEDRYSGSYSGAQYTAWWGIPPDDIDAGDTACSDFWHNHRHVLHGRGATAQAAFQDLVSRVNQEGWLFEPHFADVPGPKYGSSLYFLCASPEFFNWLAADNIRSADIVNPPQVKG